MQHGLIVFDWNGTLIADTAASLHADNKVLRHFGGKPVSLRTYRSTIIIPSINFYVAHGCSQTALEERRKEWAQVFHAWYEERAAKARMRRGARSLLSDLKRTGVKSIILSNHTVAGIEAQLNRLRISEYFASVLANTDKTASSRRRSKQSRLEAYLRRHRFSRRRSIIVGDSPEEVEIGHALGITSVALAGGYYSAARLRAAKPDFLVHSLTEVKRIIPHTFGNKFDF